MSYKHGTHRSHLVALRQKESPQTRRFQRRNSSLEGQGLAGVRLGGTWLDLNVAQVGKRAYSSRPVEIARAIL
jgi:hypothetical protein